VLVEVRYSIANIMDCFWLAKTTSSHKPISLIARLAVNPNLKLSPILPAI